MIKTFSGYSCTLLLLGKINMYGQAQAIIAAVVKHAVLLGSEDGITGVPLYFVFSTLTRICF